MREPASAQITVAWHFPKPSSILGRVFVRGPSSTASVSDNLTDKVTVGVPFSIDVQISNLTSNPTPALVVAWQGAAAAVDNIASGGGQCNPSPDLFCLTEQGHIG